MLKSPPARVTGTVDPKQAFEELRRRTTGIPTLRVTTPEGVIEAPRFAEGDHNELPAARSTLSTLLTTARRVIGPRPLATLSAEPPRTPPKTPTQPTASLLRPASARTLPRPPPRPQARPSAVVVQPPVLTTPLAVVTVPPAVPHADPRVPAPVLYMTPDGCVVAEHAVAERFIGYQVACVQFPDMTATDWLALQGLIQAAPLDIAPNDWTAFVTLLASLPVSQHEAAVLALRDIINERVCSGLEPAPQALLQALRHLPVEHFRTFGQAVVDAKEITSQDTATLAHTLRTFSLGFSSFQIMMPIFCRSAQERTQALATAVLAAEHLGQILLEASHSPRAQEWQKTFYGRGIARILSIVVQDSLCRSHIGDFQRFIKEGVHYFTHTAMTSGTLSAELLGVATRFDGAEVAKALFAEFEKRMGAGTKPSTKIARVLYQEGCSRAKVHFVARQDSPSDIPSELLVFRACFGRLFAEHGWSLPRS